MLTGKQKHYLRGLAHKQKPIVAIGQNGASESVVAEVTLALDHHELVKIKLPVITRTQKIQLIEQLCQQTGAQAVQSIGRIGVLYKSAKEPKIALPNA